MEERRKKIKEQEIFDLRNSFENFENGRYVRYGGQKGIFIDGRGV